MSKTLATEIEIGAPKERVWEILSDFPSYPHWNPFIKRIAGELREGAKLDVHIQPPGQKGITLHPTVLSAVPGKELKWLGHLFGIRGIFGGEHHLLIKEASPSGVKFVQQEVFGGVLLPLTGKLLGTTREGFEEMNRALKEKAEARDPNGERR